MKNSKCRSEIFANSDKGLVGEMKLSLYTERHGMRSPVEKTYGISIKSYSLLFDCCSRYWVNLAWKYPDECPDGNGCCGIDSVKFHDYMEFEIPTLFRRKGMIDEPAEHKNIYETESTIDDYDQYALFDLIEYIASNVHDMCSSSKNVSKRAPKK